MCLYCLLKKKLFWSTGPFPAKAGNNSCDLYLISFDSFISFFSLYFSLQNHYSCIFISIFSLNLFGRFRSPPPTSIVRPPTAMRTYVRSIVYIPVYDGVRYEWRKLAPYTSAIHEQPPEPYGTNGALHWLFGIGVFGHWHTDSSSSQAHSIFRILQFPFFFPQEI